VLGPRTTLKLEFVGKGIKAEVISISTRKYGFGYPLQIVSHFLNPMVSRSQRAKKYLTK
jgi:hypothetical protein